MRIFLVLLLMASATDLQANLIDGLRTKTDVTRFLRQQGKRKYIFGWKVGRGDTVNVTSFFKTDLNGDGLTDLVVSGKWVIAAVDQGNGKFSVHELGWAPFDDSWKKLIAIVPGKWMIVGNKETRDSLVYRAEAGGFMEYNAHPSEMFGLDSVRIDVGPCFGSCPVYDMTIHPGGSIDFDGHRDYAKLSTRQYIRLLAILDYLPLERMKSDYKVTWTDDRNFVLEITHQGRVQRIDDYGGMGSFGLELLYDYFDGLAAGFMH